MLHVFLKITVKMFYCILFRIIYICIEHNIEYWRQHLASFHAVMCCTQVHVSCGLMLHLYNFLR